MAWWGHIRGTPRQGAYLRIPHNVRIATPKRKQMGQLASRQPGRPCHQQPSPRGERRKLIKTSKMSNLAGGGGGRRRLKCRVTCCPSVKSRTVREWGQRGGRRGKQGVVAARADVFWPERALLWATDWSIGGTDADGRRTAQKWDTYGATSGTADDAAPATRRTTVD